MKEKIRYDVPIDEAKLRRTIAASKAAFLEGEAERSLSGMEFLHQQSRYIKKRWWLLQAALLAFLCWALRSMESDFLVRRSLGTAAPLFVILILPELWKNRSSDSMEVEGSTLFTLRQIYAARLTLFAGVDIALVTAFFAGASFTARLPLWEMLIQFLLPVNVTCCICFRCLYSKRFGSEVLPVLLCTFWMGLWTLVILNSAVYDRISVPVWAGALSASFLYMGYTLCHGQKLWRNILEAKPEWS